MKDLVGVSAHTNIGFKSKTTPAGAHPSPGERCAYTVSVGARHRSSDEIAAGFQWTRSRFPKCALLLGDGLYRVTLRINKGLDLLQAEKIARDEGTKLIEEISEKIDLSHADVIRTSDLLCDEEFNTKYDIIEKLSELNSSFGDSVDADAVTYVYRQIDKGSIRIDETEAISLSKLYLKQEIAIYLLLAERGWKTDIYIGSEIPTLCKIMNGEIDSVPRALKQRINIALQVKIRTGSKIRL